MSFTLSQFANSRPYLYHLTSSRNLEQILSERTIFSTEELLRASNNLQWLEKKREETITIDLNGKQIDIRDQQPLYAGKTKLEGGWTFSELVSQLNQRVFFWAGWEHKPIAHGQRHFARYQKENPIVVRIRTVEAFDENKEFTPFFCKYNSGSPRTIQGKGSPRGPNTFVEGNVASFVPSEVVEVTYVKSILLPKRVEFGESPFGPWNED